MADLSKETVIVVFGAVWLLCCLRVTFLVVFLISSVGFLLFGRGGGPACPVCWESSFRPAPATTFPTMKRSSSICLYGSFALCSPSFFFIFRENKKRNEINKKKESKEQSRAIREESGGI